MVGVLPCAVTEVMGLEWALGNRAVFLLFSPLIHNSFHAPSLTLQTSLGNQRGWGQRERRETEIVSFRGSSSSGCQKPAVHTSAPLWGCWRGTHDRGAELGHCPEPGAAAVPAVGSFLICCTLRYTSHIRPASSRSWRGSLFFLGSSLNFV